MAQILSPSQVVPIPPPSGSQVTIDSVINAAALAAVISPTIPNLSPPPVRPRGALPFVYTHLFICTGTAIFEFPSNTGGLEHAFVSFDLPDPLPPDPELEDPLPFRETGPKLVFDNPFFPLVHHGGQFGVADAITTVASPASFNAHDPSVSLWAVDWADADWDQFTGRIALTAQLAIQGDGGHSAILNRMAYQVTFLAGPNNQPG